MTDLEAMDINNLAPIVLFVYNRPWHTRRTIDALQLNNLAKDSDLIIFSDAPKDDKAFLAVKEVRDFVKTITGFKNITIIERDVNYGLVRSIKEGVTEIVNRSGKIIVLEDDLVTHPQFLEFMNTGLEICKSNKRIFSITGYSHLKSDGEYLSNTNNTYFLKIISTWSWATWADRWEFYNDDTTDSNVLNTNSDLVKKFNYDNSYPYYKMLKNRNNGKVKSWGIVWYWNVFKQNGLTLYPTETLIDQIGFDGSGQNSRNYAIINNNIRQMNYVFDFPSTAEEVKVNRLKIVKTLKMRKVNILIQIIKQKMKAFIFLKLRYNQCK
jgi:hypothetical protein